MSRSGQPENRDTFSLLVLNVSFRTTADDLFPLFDRYGEVVDIYIPRDRRTGDSRGFAFVRYNYEDEAQDAIDGLDGERRKNFICYSIIIFLLRLIFHCFFPGTGMRFGGRALMVQFAKYGPNAEKIHRGRITEENPKPRGRFRSRSPRPRYREDYRDRDCRRRSRSRSRERYEQDRYRDSDHRCHRTRSISPDYDRKHNRHSGSPVRKNPSHSRSRSPRRAPHEGTPSKPGDGRAACSGSP
ncbi:serine/arginine-rich splicing factor SC35-like isoform X1 [Miscanthus floridulus]|uniref:serine/arginine-rich splicing factor SC35-like isoform X1 n=1 Tax=Miscanthus floridulus TaxID=154761 RepID=UPI00345B4845